MSKRARENESDSNKSLSVIFQELGVLLPGDHTGRLRASHLSKLQLAMIDGVDVVVIIVR